MNKPWILFSLLAVTALIAFGCVDPNQLPIFYTLETEEPVEEDRGLPEDLNAVKMVNTGTRYFLAAGSLFTRVPGVTTKWTVVPPPIAGAFCTVIELYDGRLFAGFHRYDKDTQRTVYLGLFYTDPDTISWTAETNGGSTGPGVEIGLLKAVTANVMLVGVRDGGTDILYSYSAGAWTGTNDALSGAITDADYDGSDYWVVAGGDLYRGNPLGSLGAPEDISGVTDTAASGVFWDGTDDLYLSTKGGKLFRYEGLSSWTSSGSAAIEVDNETVKFTRFVDLSAVTGEIFVGTQGYGYYVIPASGAVASSGLPRRPPSNISGLYNGAINSFLLDTGADPDSLFVCTSGAGLWRGEYSGSDWTWKQEKGAD